MAIFQIRLLDAAIRDLKRLDHPIRKRILERIRWLANSAEGVKPEALAGEFRGLYKLRVGDYRVIYEMLRSERIILIHLIGHRRDIYKKR